MERDNVRELSRRKLLQKLTVVGALASVPLIPAKWIKPVIDTIVVPAHAQTVSGPSPSASSSPPTTPTVSTSPAPTPSPSSGGIDPSPSPSTSPG